MVRTIARHINLILDCVHFNITNLSVFAGALLCLSSAVVCANSSPEVNNIFLLFVSISSIYFRFVHLISKMFKLEVSEINAKPMPENGINKIVSKTTTEFCKIV